MIRLLRGGDDAFILDVADHDLDAVAELAGTHPFSAGWRGLMLARSFALEVGWYATEITEYVWATFASRSL